MAIYHKPETGVCADFIPFYENGKYYLFYLLNSLDWFSPFETWSKGVPWCLWETEDFVNFEDKGVILPKGSRVDHYLFNFTGSVIKKDDTYHIFYTGHNPLMTDKFGYVECILHATSKDLHNWERDELFISTYTEGYSKYDWRDPYVFWNDEFNEYWMLTCSIRDTQKPFAYSGITGLLTSPDLNEWTVQEPIFEPNFSHSHECPDMFRIGDWWYLVYSDTINSHTRYAMSKSSKGPWIIPKNDFFDGETFYAAKTAGDGNKRYIFGWLRERWEEFHRVRGNLAGYGWGGKLAVYEIVQNNDGTLSTKIPDSICQAFTKELPLENKVIFESDYYSSLTQIYERKDKSPLMLDLDIVLGKAREAGVFVGHHDFDQTFSFKINRNEGRVYMSYRDKLQNQMFVSPVPDLFNLKVILDDDCFVCYYNNETVISERVYDCHNMKFDKIGLFKTGNAEFKNVKLRTI